MSGKGRANSFRRALDARARKGTITINLIFEDMFFRPPARHASDAVVGEGPTDDDDDVRIQSALG